MKLFKTTLCATLMCLFSTLSQAEQTLETAQYVIHYNAFNSTVIDAAAAKENGLIRSKYNAMLNIAVFKKNPDDNSQTAVKSFNSGTVENLVGQQQSLNFVTIQEGTALYYIASFKFADQEQMNFEVKIQPNPNEAPIALKLSQKFYVD